MPVVGTSSWLNQALIWPQMIDWQRVQQPTNGYFGMKLALHLCDRVDVYGFVRNWRGNFKYPYFNNEEPNA